jgi:hypothetical protein
MPNGIRNRERWMNLREQMNVVFDTARREDRCFVLSRSAADVGKQVVPPVIVNQRVPKLRAEDDVDQETVVRL